MDEEPSWQRQLAIGLSALVAIGVLIGGILAVIAVQAANYVGIGNSSSNSNSGPDLVFPTTGEPTTKAPTTSPTLPTSPATTRSKQPAEHKITLSASPRSAGSFQRVNLAGSYPGHDSGTLQVQQSVGSGPWSDFPVTATVSGGRFATYIQTARVGTNHFRMMDKATGRTSNTATVTIG